MSKWKEFHRQWDYTPDDLRRALRSFGKAPTERNMAYCTGYAAALNRHGLLGEELATYWINHSGLTECSAELAAWINEET